MKAADQFFPVVPFITLHKVVLTHLDKVLKYEHTNESHRVVQFL